MVNYASITADIIRSNRPNIRPINNYPDWSEILPNAINNYYNATNQQRALDEQDRIKGLEQILAEALAGGDEAAINQAYGQLNPAGYVDYLNKVKANREASDLAFAREKELLDIQNQNAMGLARLKNQFQAPDMTSAAKNYEYLLSLGIPEKEARVTAFGGNTEAGVNAIISGSLGAKGMSAYDAEKGKQLAKQESKQAENIQQLKTSMSNITDLKNQINKDPSVFGFASPVKIASSRLASALGSSSASEYLKNYGKAYRQLGNIQNDLIAKAKSAGQSGINTAREIEQATAGLNKNSSPEEILGALDAMYESAAKLAELFEGKNTVNQDPFGLRS